MNTAKRIKTTNKKCLFAVRFKSSLKELYAKYDIVFSDTNVTNLELECTDKVETLTFMDESRKLHKCMLSTIDFNNSSEYCCFWDRHQFSSQPIGCPVRYIPDVITRTYFSEISKEKFSVKESVIQDQRISEDILFKKDSNNYYETLDIFCGFSCCLAFIQDPSTRRNPIYKDSEVLLHKMHYDIYGTAKITPASHWRILKVYGGFEDIISFRSNCSKVDYENKGLYKPYFKPYAHAFEEKIKF